MTEKEKKLPLMRKATAVWLVNNTSLTFEQIADFCGLHELEVQGIADGDVNTGITPQSPIDNHQLTREMIKACEADPNRFLELNESAAFKVAVKGKKNKAKYIAIARRGDKPNAIAFLIKYFPEINEKLVRKLVGTTTAMIKSIKNRTHWNIKEIKPRDPVLLGLCTQEQLNNAIKQAKDEIEKKIKELEKEKKKAEKEKVKKVKKEKKKATKKETSTKTKAKTSIKTEVETPAKTEE
jgi:uncharacterized protein